MCFLPTGQLLCGSAHHRLPPSLLDVKRVRDINRSKRAQAAVKCLEFHPTASVALTAGWHKTLDLFQVYTVSVYCLMANNASVIFRNVQNIDKWTTSTTYKCIQ